MNRFNGNFIGKNIGRVLEVDVKEDDTGWGPFLQIKVEINLSNHWQEENNQDQIGVYLDFSKI